MEFQGARDDKELEGIGAQRDSWQRRDLAANSCTYIFVRRPFRGTYVLVFVDI